MIDLLDMLTCADRDFQRSMEDNAITDAALEAAAGSGNLAEGRSTPGDGTSNPGVNCTCCCN